MKNNFIAIAISGGIDSTIAAWLLKKLNYKLLAIYMINWIKTDCYKNHLLDVIKIINILNIKLKILNYENLYKNNIFKKFIKNYKDGLTPNPDIDCNKLLKFKILLKYALKIGAWKLATGHHAKITKFKSQYFLKNSKDKIKDQTYFLYKLNSYQLSKLIFPIGNLYKKEIRQIAEKLNLPNKNKKDSYGLCFIENRNFKKFINIFIKKKFGYTLNKKKQILSIHDGIHFYTIGQKKNLRIENKCYNTKLYIFKKNIKKNILYITNNIKNIWLFSIGVLINKIYCKKKIKINNYYLAKIRHSIIYIICYIKYINKTNLLIKFNKLQWGISIGQSIVFYKNKICFGGGIIKSIINIFN